VARVIALVPDLLFGSQVQGSLQAAGHDVALAGDEAKVRERLTQGRAETGSGDTGGAGAHGGMEPGDADATVLVIDLTDDRFDGAAILEALAADSVLADVRTLAFYSHVDAAVRERAMQAGFDLVVPRSRMAREGAALVSGLADEG
jgi:DNA-binding NarL/FixJ family response regulator